LQPGQGTQNAPDGRRRITTGEEIQGVAQFLDVNPQLVALRRTQIGKNAALPDHPTVVVLQQWRGKGQYRISQSQPLTMGQYLPPGTASQPVVQALLQPGIFRFGQPIQQRLIMALADQFSPVAEQDQPPFAGKPV